MESQSTEQSTGFTESELRLYTKVAKNAKSVRAESGSAFAPLASFV
jgi:hypothetical protein